MAEVHNDTLLYFCSCIAVRRSRPRDWPGSFSLSSGGRDERGWVTLFVPLVNEPPLILPRMGDVDNADLPSRIGSRVELGFIKRLKYEVKQRRVGEKAEMMH